jgi:hypothetical protein
MERNFKHNHSLLLHIIYEAFLNGSITQKQKTQLKGKQLTLPLECIFRKNGAINKIIEDYEKSNDYALLIKDFMFLLDEANENHKRNSLETFSLNDVL